MDSTSRAVEMTGTVDEQGQLHLDGPLSFISPQRVRVILLFPAETDIDEQEWLRAAARNPTFDFLNDSAEDIYTLADGKPFHD
jgi:hypothetical protein